MANNTDPAPQEKRVATVVVAKETSKAAKLHAALPAIKTRVTREDNSVATNMSGDGSRFGVGAYIVDFINRNNIKIVRKFLED